MEPTPLATQANMAEHSFVGAIGRQTGLDPVIDRVQQPVYDFLMKYAPLRTALAGTWIGHPIHAVLTDVPIGAWTAGVLLDLMDTLSVNRGFRRAADFAHTVGLVGALSSAIFGIADWSYTMDRPKRVGFVHGATNVLITGIFSSSLLARSKGKRTTGITLSTIGWSLLLFSGWLGGELVYRYGIGVDHTAFQEGPGDWVDVLSDAELGDGQPRRVEAQGTPVLLLRQGNEIHAIGDTCSHLGCSLAEGKMEGEMIVCPCHGSGFRISDGEVLQGPATLGQPAFQVRVQGGRIAVKKADQ